MQTAYNKPIHFIVCVCGAKLTNGEIWCEQCKPLGEVVKIPSGFDKFDLIWTGVFAMLLGVFIGVMLTSYVIGG